MSTIVTNPKFFTKEDGKLYYLPNVPEYLEYGCNGKPICCRGERCRLEVYLEEYNLELQKAKDNAIEVGNKDEVLFVLIPSVLRSQHGEKWALYVKANTIECLQKETIYTLTGKYEVEIKELCAHDSCPDDAGCDHCKEPKQLAFIKQQEVEQVLFDKVLKSVPQEVKDEVDKQMKEVSEQKRKPKISDKMLEYAYEICWLVKDHTGNVIASMGKEGAAKSDLEHYEKASAFIKSYQRYQQSLGRIEPEN